MNLNTIITICLGNVWDFGVQIKENQEKVKKKLKQEKLAKILENANASGALQFKILTFLKEISLGESGRGLSPWEIKELFYETEINVREALRNLESQNLVGYTGTTKGKKYVAVKFLDQAKQNFEGKSK